MTRRPSRTTEVERRVLPAGVVVDEGDAEGLDGDGGDAQQQLTQKQQGVRPQLGGALLPAAALIGGGGNGALRLAETGAVLSRGCRRRTKHLRGALWGP